MLSDLISVILIGAAVLAVLAVACLVMRRQIFDLYLRLIKRYGLGKSSEDAVFTYPLF